MITNNNVWHSPVRKVNAKVELYEGSTLVNTFTEHDRIKSFDIQRVGNNSKFFGFGVCQRLNIHFIDVNRELEISTANEMKIYLNCGGDDLNAFPTFYVSEVRRDENTNEISVTAYDKVYNASNHTVKELGLTTPYTVMDVAVKIAETLQFPEIVLVNFPTDYPAFETSYSEGANFDGAESLRETLDAIAEVTQTVYYLDYLNRLVFKMPDRDGEPVHTIQKAEYIKLDSKTNRRLSDICCATELGDNTITESGVIGTTQYVRDNPFWELRADISALLSAALIVIGNLTINQFNCSWRGNPSIEIGDKIALVTKDGNTVYSYLFDDTIKYTGHLAQTTKWEFANNDTESTDNPVSLGDVLKQTYAKVDKANKQIDLVVKDVNEATEAMAQLQLTTDELAASVKRVESNNNGNTGTLQQQLDEITKMVESTMTAEEVSLEISKQIANGTTKVTTTTGFTFDETGLTVSKTGSEIETTITEDGMTVSKSGEEVLIANNTGVYATNLHATTYLMIGVNSRFEDYDNNSRTGCFWIGQ